MTSPTTSPPARDDGRCAGAQCSRGPHRLKLAATAAALAAAAHGAQAQGVTLDLLVMPAEAVEAFGKLQVSSPGLPSALVAMRAARICRGVRIEDEHLEQAVAIVSAALSPSLRRDPDVSHGRFEREQINALADHAKAFGALRAASVDCSRVEPLADELRTQLKLHGAPFVDKLARVVQQSPASNEIVVEQPILNITVQEQRRSIWPWNW